MLINEDFLDNLDDRDIVTDEVSVETVPLKIAPDDFGLIFQVNCQRNKLVYCDLLLKHLFKTFAPITAYSRFVYIADPYNAKKKETYQIEDALNTSEDYIHIHIGIETNFRTLNQLLTFISIIDDIFSGLCFSGFEIIINTLKYGRRLWISNTYYLNCYRRTGAIDVCLDQRMSAHEELMTHLSQFISLLIPERLQLREFDKLVDFIKLTLKKRVMDKVCEEAFNASRTYNYTAIPREFKKDMTAATIDLPSLVGNKTLEMVYCQDGDVKDLKKKTSSSEEFRAMTEQLGTVSCKDFLLRANLWSETIYLVIWAGTFLFDRNERATRWTFSKMPLSAALAFHFEPVRSGNNERPDYEAVTDCLRNIMGIDITENEIKDIIHDNAKRYSR